MKIPIEIDQQLIAEALALGASQFCLKGEFTSLAPPSLVGKGAGGLGLFAKLRCSPSVE